jgi:type IV fimbrial biogenesis protein FimT
VFSLTNSTTPDTILPLPAVANGTSWAIYTLPSVAGEASQFIESGVLSNASSQVTIGTTNNVSTVCFNSIGRLVANTSANVTAITGGDTCAQPTAPPAPPTVQFNINVPGADRPLRVNLSLGGQVHMCVPGMVVDDDHPEACP